jgi:tetratricopeptide (TPR) repeat protein
MTQEHLLEKADLAKAKGDYVLAEKCYRDCLTIAPRNAEAMRELGFLRYGIHKDYQVAKDLFIQSLQIENCFTGHFYLAIVLARMGKIQEAEKEYLKALEQANSDGDRGLGETEYADFLGINGRLDEAVKHFKEALAVCPNYERAKKRHYALLQVIAQNESSVSGQNAGKATAP